MERSTLIAVHDLTLRFGERVVMHDVSFSVRRGDMFVIMGPGGSGKTMLLDAMIGLVEPAVGEVRYDGESLTRATPERRRQMSRRFGVLFQLGALWSSLTLVENVALPLTTFTHLASDDIRELAALKLALVGLDRFGESYPEEVSATMRKRAGIARAMALDPEILFLDEPTAGLGPIGARHIDDLIAELRASLGTTIVSVSDDLASIFSIANDGIYLDARQKTVVAHGDPRELLANPPNPHVRAFLTRTADLGAS
jgi:phospholipid/cholesterol/gamma-HCH transport system ATP-binding protein